MRYLAQYENLDAVREFAAEAAAETGLNDAATFQVQMAVDEAFTNIIEHAYGGESTQGVEVTCEIAGDALILTLKDCGTSFDPGLIGDPDLEAPLEEREAGGLGLYFMRKLMDDVQFLFNQAPGNEEGCNILTMVKRKEKAA
jgi:serine/threonine-protein kinase RsbW